jgi:hypothetical protein
VTLEAHERKWFKNVCELLEQLGGHAEEDDHATMLRETAKWLEAIRELYIPPPKQSTPAAPPTATGTPSDGENHD